MSAKKQRSAAVRSRGADGTRGTADSCGHDMLINLNKNATTTPAIRDVIQNATCWDYQLARQLNVTRDTIHNWRSRDTVADGSLTPRRLQNTLNAGQEELVINLRTHLRLSLDNLLAVVREFIGPAMTGMSRPARSREPH